MDIKNTRQKIDEINNKMTELFIERMKLSSEIGIIKSKEGLSTENVQREREIIINETAKMPDDIKVYGKQFYQTIFSTSKAYQSNFIFNSSNVINEIKKAIHGEIKSFPVSASVACQGVNGSYAQCAADKMFSIASISYFKDWDSVFNAVEKGLCRYGVLPIENSSVGSVNEVYDLMKKHNFYIVKALKLKISHFLLAKKGVDIKSVKEIVSHEKAISQCSEFLSKLDVKITVCSNTATAAKMVSESDRNDIACISSEECASIYGLNIISANIHNNENNFTRFIAISKNLEIYEGSNKISIMVNLPHESGSLNALLNRFSSLNLNLTKLESRPIPNSAFEFAFYFDFEANITHQNVQNLIAELDNSSARIVFLGSYEERA